MNRRCLILEPSTGFPVDLSRGRGETDQDAPVFERPQVSVKALPFIGDDADLGLALELPGDALGGEFLARGLPGDLADGAAVGHGLEHGDRLLVLVQLIDVIEDDRGILVAVEVGVDLDAGCPTVDPSGMPLELLRLIVIRSVGRFGRKIGEQVGKGGALAHPGGPTRIRHSNFFDANAWQ